MLTPPAFGAGNGTGGDPPADAPAPGPEKPATEPDPAPQDLRRPLPERGVPRAAATLPVAVPEIEFAIETDPAAEPDAHGREPEREETLWRMPEAMIREEFGAEPANLRIVRVSGQAMEPVLRTGDRLIVDTAKRNLGTGGLFVLRGLGGGLEVWRVEPVRGSDPPALRLSCAHPRYQDHTCLARDLDVFGEAIRKITRE